LHLVADCCSVFYSAVEATVKSIYKVAQNKIPHWRICNISATGGVILKILEAT